LYIRVAMRTFNPTVRRFRVNDAIAFQAVDCIDDKTEIEDYVGKFHGGVVRPFLKWETKNLPKERTASGKSSDQRVEY